LASYTKTNDHFKPGFIELVLENQSNPVIPLPIEFLEQHSLPFRINTSKDVRDDIQVITKDKALVTGRGSFALGDLCFNDGIRRLYAFEKIYRLKELLPQSRDGSIECVNVIDKKEVMLTQS